MHVLALPFELNGRVLVADVAEREGSLALFQGRQVLEPAVVDGSGRSADWAGEALSPLGSRLLGKLPAAALAEGVAAWQYQWRLRAQLLVVL